MSPDNSPSDPTPATSGGLQNRAEELYHALIEQAGEGFWWTDASGCCLEVNNAACQTLGFTREELLGYRVRDLFHPEDQPGRAEDLRRVHSGELVRAERRIRRKDGSYVLVEGAARPVGDHTLIFFHDVTQRRAAEEALRHQEAEFRALFELAAVGAAQAEVETGRFTRVNQKLCELTGYTAEELLTRSFFDLTHPDDRTPSRHAQNATLQGENSASALEKRYVRKDGTVIWVQVSWSLLRDDAGRPLRSLAIIQDITAAKEAHAALVASERALRETERLAGMGSWTLDLATGEEWWSEHLYRMYQIDPATASPSLDKTRNLIHPDDWPAIEATLAHALETGEPYQNLEHRALRPDGTIRWFLAQGTVKLGVDGRPQQVVGCSLDITDRKQAELARHASEARYRVLTNVVPQLVWTMSPEGELLDVNDRWCEYYGLSSGELQQSGWASVVHPDDLDHSVECWTASLTTGEDLEVACRLRRCDGEYRWHLARGVAVRDASGTITLWCGTCTDVHERQLAEETLRAEHRRKDEFLAMLAHELRNPLAPIANATEILRLRAGERDAVEKQRETIERNTRHLARLVDDLLEVARINEGKIELRPERVNLAELVRQAVAGAQSHFETRQQHATVSLPTEPLYLHADPIRLVQIILNLLTNASKYTAPGGEVTVTATSDGRHVRLAVRDTGRGIAPELLPRIFDLFTQGERSLARTEGGLGVGLTLARRLAELHGGTVTAYSAGSGQGSEFVVCLPMANSEAEAATPSPSPSPAGSPIRRILIVEDNADAADSLAELLTLWEFDVRVVRDGVRALVAATEFQPDAILLDLGLPGLDGLEVARRLRAEVGSQALILALTGYGDREHRQRTQEAGFDGHLVKPLDPDLLRARLQDARSRA